MTSHIADPSIQSWLLCCNHWPAWIEDCSGQIIASNAAFDACAFDPCITPPTGTETSGRNFSILLAHPTSPPSPAWVIRLAHPANNGEIAHFCIALATDSVHPILEVDDLPMAAAITTQDSTSVNQHWIALLGYPADFYRQNADWMAQLFGTLPGIGQDKDYEVQLTLQAIANGGDVRTLDIWQLTRQHQAILLACPARHEPDRRPLVHQGDRSTLALICAGVGVWDWTLGADTVALSPQFNLLAGQEAHWQTCSFDDFLNLFTESHQDRIADYIQSHLVANTEINIRCQLKCGSNRLRWVEMRGMVTRPASNQDRHLIGTIQDITSHRDAQQALTHTEHKLHTFKQVAHLGHWEWTPSGNRLDWSAEMYTLHRLPVGRPDLGLDLTSFTALVFPPDQENVRRLLHESMCERAYRSIEYRISCQDGRLADIWLTSYPRINSSGELLSLYGTAQEVTERKNIERQIAGEKKILEWIASNSSLGDTLNELCSVIENLLPGAFACIQLIEPPDDAFVIAAAPSLPAALQQALADRHLDPYSGSAAAAVILRKTIISEDITSDPVWASVRYPVLNCGMHACWATPVISRSGQIAGALSIFLTSRRRANPFECGLLDRMAHLSAIAIDNHAAEAALRQSEERWLFALEGSRNGVWDWLIERNEAFYSAQYEAILQLPPDEHLETRIDSWFALVHPDDRIAIEQSISTCLAGEQDDINEEFRIRCGTGRYLWVMIRGKIMARSPSGNAIRIIGTLTDISTTKQTERQLRLNAQVFEHAGEGILITDRFNRIISVNQAFTRITGYELTEVLGKTPAILSSGKHDEVFYQSLWTAVMQHDYWQGEIWNKRKNREDYPEWLTITAVRQADGQISNFIGSFSDLSERKKQDDHIQFLANFDRLTHLPNRSLFRDRAENAIVAAQRTQTRLAIMVINLDRFKTINDSLGHHTGDQLLQESAARLSAHIPDTSTAARLGSDEFALLLSEIEQPSDAANLAHAILEQLKKPIHLAAMDLRVTASIGIALFPEDGNNFENLMLHADLAMHHAKASGRGKYQFFTENLNASILEQLKLENALRQALEGNQLQIHFQPQFDARTRLMTGAEALLRWQHPELGTISPARFIPVAEQGRLITQIDHWVLNRVCQHMAEWLQDRLPPPPLPSMFLPPNSSTRNLFIPSSNAPQAMAFRPGYWNWN